MLATDPVTAFWITSWPFAEYVKHAWAGAWICSAFRNEDSPRFLSSDLILDALAATRWRFGEPPPLGMITFVDPTKTRRKRDPGRCFRRAGFVPARCPVHATPEEECPACHGRTRAGLIALQLLPSAMPAPRKPHGAGEQNILDDWFSSKGLP